MDKLTLHRNRGVFVCCGLLLTTIIYFVLFSAYRRRILPFPPPPNSTIQFAPIGFMEALVDLRSGWRELQAKSFKPVVADRNMSHLNVTRSSLIDPELYRHLRKYNPLLPTDYEFYPDSFLSKMNQNYFLKATAKDVMGKYVHERLGGKRNGFFIECGAYDGVWISNTAWLEKNHNWTGLLIEVNPNQASVLQARNRKAYVADTCLSPEMYPVNVEFTLVTNGRSFIPNIVRKKEKGTLYPVKCYPLHMILDAIGVYEIDYFSLDVEGVDLDVLKTIPWHRVKIKLISVEVLGDKIGEPINKYLEAVGYQKINHIVSKYEFLKDDVYELIE